MFKVRLDWRRVLVVGLPLRANPTPEPEEERDKEEDSEQTVKVRNWRAGGKGGSCEY